MEGIELKDDLMSTRVYAPIQRTGWKFYLAVSLLMSVIAWGVYAYMVQFVTGLGVTGMNRPMYWGIYMANFVFFIGISHAGTLISAILRVTKAEWRRPITRCAEVITVFALMFGALSVIMDLGRPDRLLNVLQHGRLQSPILWDVVCISTYMTGSLIYLYLPLIPDVAILRDRKIGWTWLYRVLALGYQGTEKQKKRLEFLIGVMAVLIIPIAISVHTVVSYIFATTLQPAWHSTIFGPYFVVGAIFSGIAALLIAMAVIRKSLGLQGVLKDIHFNRLGLLLFVMDLIMIYFTFGIYLVEITGNEPFIMEVIMKKITGPEAIPFWGMIGLGFIMPAVILAFPKGRSVKGCVIASVFILVGMWIERFLIIVPTLSRPRLPWPEGIYSPTWVEWSITAGCLAAFALGYVLFAKIFPIISVWEVREGTETAVSHATETLNQYTPDETPGEKFEKV